MKLEQALREAAVEAKRSTAGVVPDQPPTGNRRPAALATGFAVLLSLIVGIGGYVVMSNSGDSTSVDTDAAVADDEPTSEEAPAETDDAPSPPTDNGDGLIVTDGTPEGLTLHFAGPTSELGPIQGTTRFTIYGQPDRGPGPEDHRLKILEATGEAGRPPSLPPGEDLDLGGRPGRLLADPSPVVMFEHADSLVQLYSGTLSADELIAAATAITFDAEGKLEPLVDLPGELTLLGSYERHYHDDADMGVPSEGEVTVYRAGSARYLDVSSIPLDQSERNLYLWAASATTRIAELGERQVRILEEHDQFGSSFIRMQWFEDSSLLEVIAFGLTEEEMADALQGLRSGGEAVEIGEPELVPVDPDASATGADFASSPRLIPTAIPDGLAIAISTDIADLGPPGFSDTRYVYGPAEVAEPGPTDPVLSLSIGEAPPGLFYGEAIKIGGFDAVIVDKEAAGTSVDVQMIAGGKNFQFRGISNLTIDQIVAAAQEYARWVTGAPGDVGPLDTVGVDLELRLQEEYLGWMDIGIGGVPNSSMVILANSSRSSELQVSTWSAHQRQAKLSRWVNPDSTATVDVEGNEAFLSEPVDGIYVLRFAVSDRVIELRSSGLSESELLTAAGSLRAATDDEWNLGLP